VPNAAPRRLRRKEVAAATTAPAKTAPQDIRLRFPQKGKEPNRDEPSPTLVNDMILSVSRKGALVTRRKRL
jgi:hypothetical protein